MIALIRSELDRHRWIAPGLALSASAALGAHLTEMVAHLTALVALAGKLL